MSDWRKFGLLQRGKFESGPNIRHFPATCAGRVKMLHTHALTDTTMPLAGRYLGKAEGMWARIAQANRARASVARRTIAGGGRISGVARRRQASRAVATGEALSAESGTARIRLRPTGNSQKVTALPGLCCTNF